MIRVCPHCGGALLGERAIPDGLADAEPRPGDLAVCAHCGVSLVYGAALEFRLLTLVEYVQLKPAERARLSLGHVLYVVRKLYGAAGAAAIEAAMREQEAG